MRPQQWRRMSWSLQIACGNLQHGPTRADGCQNQKKKKNFENYIRINFSVELLTPQTNDVKKIWLIVV